MTRQTLAKAAAAALIALAVPRAPARAEGAATQAVKRVNEGLRGALRQMIDSQGAAWDKHRAEARTQVAALLDFEALAEGTLGKRWAELRPKERSRYVEALRSAMEGSYLSRMQGKVAVDEVKVEYLGEEPKDGRTLVKTTVVHGADAAAIDYLMEPAAKGHKARAVDVITEGVSLAETYREQINTLWPKKGFEGVVGAFEKKAKRFEADLAERRSGGGSSKGASSR